MKNNVGKISLSALYGNCIAYSYKSESRAAAPGRTVLKLSAAILYTGADLYSIFTLVLKQTAALAVNKALLKKRMLYAPALLLSFPG